LPGVAGESVRVGKAPDNDLVLPEETVSRQHLALERTSTGIVVRDLESRNGLHIGGALVREATVRPGTILVAGDVELLVGVEMRDAALPASDRCEFGLAVGSTLPMRRIFAVLEQIAPTPASVLLMGETGTGKDALAQSIHAASPRADRPFVVLDCGAISAQLIESELFGHERGAFTGAVYARAGAFERAEGGTLFLDEIGELAIELQPKLLRVLEAREFQRVGGTRIQKADVRVIAATTRDLREEAQRGTFRDDLYFRISVVTIRVPPLRERLDDIGALAERLLAGIAPEPPTVDPETIAALKAHDWPGNVRELRNVLERAVHLTRAAPAGRALRLDDWPPPTRVKRGDDEPRFAFDEGASYRENRARFEASFERGYVEWLLERHDGNYAAAARQAKMDRTHLMDLAKKHSVEKRRR
jgi:transcriptional regulator with GAF, ATPase, and Fis domain